MVQTKLVKCIAPLLQITWREKKEKKKEKKKKRRKKPRKRNL